MTYSERCVCGHPAEAHEHYRPGADCGACGPGLCPWYISLADRDELAGRMTAGQRLMLAESDAHLYRNLAALTPFTATARARNALVSTIPMQARVPTIAHELEARRAARVNRGKGATT